MSIEGKWNLLIDSPMGEQEAEAEFHVDGDELTGTVVNRTQNAQSEVSEGVIDGDEVSWRIKLAKVKISAKFEVKVDGDKLAGKVSAGLFGKFPVTGERALPGA